MNRGFKIGFIMDPVEALTPEEDTSFSILMECQRRGHRIFYIHLEDLLVYRGVAMAELQQVKIGPLFEVIPEGTKEKRPLSWLDVVFNRKEPPFNMDYIYATYILSLTGGKTFLINDPHGIRGANEKLYALNFPDITPETCVSKNPLRLKAFLKEVGGEMVIKPLNERGGHGVLYLREGDKNLNAILEVSTQNGREYIVAQRYLPESRQGDKRILILDGEPIGAFLRLPPEEDFRANMHVGGKAVKADLTETDRRICSVLSERFRQDGLYFVGIDVIGNKVTEINVTSPAGIPEINAFNHVRLEEKVVDFLEKKVEERK
jgi:glutathione synthase